MITALVTFDKSGTLITICKKKATTVAEAAAKSPGRPAQPDAGAAGRGPLPPGELGERDAGRAAADAAEGGVTEGRALELFVVCTSVQTCIRKSVSELRQ